MDRSSGERQISRTKVSQVFRKLRADTHGVSAAEYAILLGIIGGSIAIAALTLGDTVGCSLEQSASIVAGDPTGHGYGRSDPNGLAKGHRANC